MPAPQTQRHSDRRPSADQHTPLLQSRLDIHQFIPGPELSPCPALNALCNHGAFGMPRDGHGVQASVLTKAIAEVYGLEYWLAWLIVYGAFIAGFKSRTINLQQLCKSPVAHWAALVHGNPWSGSVRGHPDAHLCEQLIALADDGNVDLDTFAEWRNMREKNLLVEGQTLRPGQHHIAAGELALLLQVLGDAHDNWKVSSAELRAFLEQERLPHAESWAPRRTIGLRSTIRVSRQILTKMDVQDCRLHIPLYVYALATVCLIAGVVFALRSLLH